MAPPFAIPKPPVLAEGCWPTREQTLLLHAALSERGLALDAWQAWNRLIDLEREHIDIGSYRLLPLVYKHLLRDRPDAPHAGRAQGLYKRTWYENQMRFRVYAPALHALADAGFETLILKGYPLAVQYYGDLAARPMADLDLLVPRQQVFPALGVLACLGWTAIEAVELTPAILDLKPSHGLRNAEGIQLDLHWHVLHYCLDEGVAARFWSASEPLRINGVDTRALSAEDQLLHVCAHGLACNEVPPIRWIADALTIIGSRAVGLDWDRLLARAELTHTGLQLHATLSYLRDEFRSPIPDRVIRNLARLPASPARRGLFAALTRGGLWGNAGLLWYGFRVNERHGSSWWNPLAFLDYVRVMTGQPGHWQVIRWALSRIAARLSRRLVHSAGPLRRSTR